MWCMCCCAAYRPVAVSIEDDWVLVARRLSTALLDSSLAYPWPWPPPPNTVSQLRHVADEARQRSFGWRRRNKLFARSPPLQPQEAEATKTAYAVLGITPPV